jgi:hypothetical protein
MANSKKRTPLVEDVRPYVEGVAKNLVEKLYGPQGPAWGTKLADIEHLLLDLREVLTEKMLAEALSRQAATHDQRPLSHRCCPSCQEPLTCDTAEPRLIQTDAGEAHWSEPQAYCRKCRQAFFPSVPEPGPGPQRLQSGGAG